MAANIGVVAVLTRWGPRVAVGGAALLAAVGMGVIAGAHSVLLLAAGVVVAGAAAGMSFPPYADIVAGQVRPEKRDVVWSTISSGTGWGVAIAGPIAIVAGAQWRVAWVIFVAIGGGGRCAGGVPRTGRRGPASTSPAAEHHAGSSARSPVRSCCPPYSSAWAARCGGRSVSTRCGSPASTRALPGSSTQPAESPMLLASLSGAVFARFGLRPSYLVSTFLLAASLAVFGLATAHQATAMLAADRLRRGLRDRHRGARRLELAGLRGPPVGRPGSREHGADDRHARRTHPGRRPDPAG